MITVFANQQLEMALRLLAAALLSALIGWQREKAHKPAGFRTHILIGVGASLFTMISVYLIGGVPSQIAAGVVSGIGFLGAGAILHRSHVVEGLTTAASVWVVAAIGMAAGAGFYIIAGAATIIVFIVLFLRVPN
jgi:putative Mg2+ transporter-C (MgtC) family protein